jgi:hypothetical protein
MVATYTSNLSTSINLFKRVTSFVPNWVYHGAHQQNSQRQAKHAGHELAVDDNDARSDCAGKRPRIKDREEPSKPLELPFKV